jgi:hypothetical protein
MVYGFLGSREYRRFLYGNGVIFQRPGNVGACFYMSVERIIRILVYTLRIVKMACALKRPLYNSRFRELGWWVTPGPQFTENVFFL